jgi:hypothetical protein
MSDSLGAVVDIIVATGALLTVILVIVVWIRAWMRCRHPQISIADLQDRTGRNDFEVHRSAWTGELLWKFLDALRTVHEWVREEYSGDSVQPAANTLGLKRQASVSSSTNAWQDETMQRLMTSLQGDAPRQIAAPLQIMTELITTPRGTLVTATLCQKRHQGRDRLGLTVEMTDLAGALRSRHTLWELGSRGNEEAAGEGSADQVGELIDAAAFWIAVESVDMFLRPKRLQLRRKQRKGLVDNLFGLVYQAAYSYGERGEEFLRMAVGKFQASARAFPDDYHPHMNLGLTFMNLASTRDDPQERERYLRRAVEAYSRSITVAKAIKTSCRDQQRSFVIHRLQEALALAQLHSSRSEVRGQALGWIEQESNKIERNRRRLQDSYKFDPASIYNVACMWALAAEVQGNESWRERALTVLGVALAKDPDGYLWEQAPEDPDLRILGDTHWRTAFQDRLRQALTAEGNDNRNAAELEMFVKRLVKEAKADDRRPGDGQSRRPPSRPASEATVPSTSSSE